MPSSQTRLVDIPAGLTYNLSTRCSLTAKVTKTEKSATGEVMKPRPPATGQTTKATQESNKQETARSNRKWEIPASFLL